MLQSSLSDLIHNYEINKPGICAVFAADVEGVSSMPSAKDLMKRIFSPEDCDFYTAEIVLATGYEWLEVSKLFNVNLAFTGEEEYTVNNNALEYTVALSVPNDDFETRGKVLRAYENREFILIVKERTGAWRVMGSLDKGCKFTKQLQSGAVRKGANRIDGAFTWQVGGHEALYVKAFPETVYFEFIADGSINQSMRISTNEPIMVDWGDGSTITVHQPGEATHEYTGTDAYTVRVYHRNIATSLQLNYQETLYNGNISAVTGTLPVFLTTVNFAADNLSAADIEEILTQLDDNGQGNGTANFQTQINPVTPTGTMNSLKAALEAKGWTVTF